MPVDTNALRFVKGEPKGGIRSPRNGAQVRGVG
jgi:hypothetical protein